MYCEQAELSSLWQVSGLSRMFSTSRLSHQLDFRRETHQVTRGMTLSCRVVTKFKRERNLPAAIVPIHFV